MRGDPVLEKQRTMRNCETEDLEAEEEHLRTIFRKNGYPRGFITGAMKRRREQEETQQGRGAREKDLVCTTAFERDLR